MQNRSIVKKVLIALLLVCLAQAVWIVAALPVEPPLSRIAMTYPIGDNGMLYAVVSDAGGATVPFTYRYYVYERIDDRQKALEALRANGKAFLVTRDESARVDVRGTVVKIAVSKDVYSFTSSTLFRHGVGYTPVSVWLSAQPSP